MQQFSNVSLQYEKGGNSQYFNRSLTHKQHHITWIQARGFDSVMVQLLFLFGIMVPNFRFSNGFNSEFVCFDYGPIVVSVRLFCVLVSWFSFGLVCVWFWGSGFFD